MTIDYQPGRPDYWKPVTLYKTSDQTKTSDNTVAADGDIAGFSILEDGIYSIEGLLHFDCSSSSGGGMNFDFALSTTPGGFAVINCVGIDGATNSHLDSLGWSTGSTNCSNFIWTGYTESDYPSVQLAGMLLGNASSDATLDFRWAQSTSNANGLTLKKGSWIRVTRLG